MRRNIKAVISNPIFSGSAVMVIGSNATNFINFLYQLLMGKTLSPSNYGELASLLSILGLISMIPFSLGLTIVKFVSSAKSEQEVRQLINFLSARLFVFGFIIFCLMSAGSFYLANFLRIENPILIVLIAATFIFSLPAFFYKSVLQGLLRFNQLVISTLGESLSKLLLAMLAIYWGFAVQGVVLALVASTLISFVAVTFFTRDLKGKNSKKIKLPKTLITYSLPVLIQSVSLTSLYSSDLILVKHFFSSYESGLYAALSNLGRIIFFGAGPISAVMFPMVAKRQASGENYRRIFFISVLLTVGFSAMVLVFYYFFPSVAVKALYGSSYINAASFLVWFGIFMTIFTISSLLLSFYLSIGKVKVVVLPLAAALLQIILIALFHSNLKTVILDSIIVSSLLLLVLGIDFFQNKN